MRLNALLLVAELLALTLVLLLIHRRSRRGGLAGLLMFVAGLVATLHTVGAIPVMVEFVGGIRVAASDAVLVPVLLSALLILYVAEGTAAARTTIVAVLALSVLVLFWQFAREVHLLLPGGSNSLGLPADSPVFARSWSVTAASMAAFTVSLGAIAILYQAAVNLRLPWAAALAPGIALLGALTLDDITFRLIAFGWDGFVDRFPGGIPAKLFAGTLLFPVLGLYLTRWSPHLEDETRGLVRPVFDLIMGSLRRREAELKATEIRFRSTFDQAPVGLVQTDAQGAVVMANRAFRDLLSFGPGEVEGKGYLELLEPGERAEHGPAITEVFSGRRNSYAADVRFLRSDNRTVWARVSVTGIQRGGTGEPLFVATAEDLTDRRATEAQLRQAQKMEAVGQLTGGVAHDFNNLLTVVLGGLELAILDADTPERREPLEEALEAAERGAALTQQLLAFSRRQTLAPRRLDARELVEGLRVLLRRSLPESITLHTEGERGEAFCLVDQPLLETALLNLVLNARDALPEGGTVTLRTGVVEVGREESLRQRVRTGDYVRIQVTDDGTGIHREVLDRVLEPFFTTKEVGRGSGLGLSMVLGFVEQSGGFLTIESEPGEGTTVSLHLPVAGDGPAVGPAQVLPEAPSQERGQGQLLLLLEDDAQVRRHLARTLEGLGYRVLEAEEGESALSRLREEAGVQLLVTDVILPGGMSGVEVAGKATALRPGLPVVFVSGYSADNLKAIPPEIRPRILQKPFRREELARAVAAGLREGARAR